MPLGDYLADREHSDRPDEYHEVGTVTSTSPLLVAVGADSTGKAVTGVLNGYTPRLSDVVIVLVIGATRTVLGPVSSIGGGTGIVAVGTLPGAAIDAPSASTAHLLTPTPITYTTKVGRRYKIVLRVRAIQPLTGVAQGGVFNLYDEAGPTLIQSDWHWQTGASGYGNADVQFIRNGDGVSRQFGFRVSNTTFGSGGTRFYVEGPTVGAGSQFYIEDVGPA